MSDEPFVWTFPLYFLIEHFDLDKQSGALTLRADTEFLGADINGEHHFALYTDADLAERHREACREPSGVLVVPSSAANLLPILRAIAVDQEKVIVDADPRTGWGFVFLTTEVIAVLESHLRGET